MTDHLFKAPENLDTLSTVKLLHATIKHVSMGGGSRPNVGEIVGFYFTMLLNPGKRWKNTPKKHLLFSRCPQKCGVLKITFFTPAINTVFLREESTVT